MDRSLMQKALAKGTRRIDLKILDDVEVVADAIEAECSEVCEDAAPPIAVAVALPRTRRATDAYVPAREDRPIIAVG
jgi:hypothetical protein